MRELFSKQAKSFRTRSTARPAATLEEALGRAREAWNAELAGFRNELGIIEFDGFRLLIEEHMANCRLLPSRFDLVARMPRNAVCAEVGVQTGRFSRFILDTLAPRKLHLIDLDHQSFGIAQQFAAEIAAGQVDLHEGDSSTILSNFEDAIFDFIYIDGDHGHEGVKKDVAAAVSKLKPEGILIFNDYTFWSPAECMPYGVIHAVNALCLDHDWELIYLAFGQMGYNDVAVRRRAS